MTILTQNFYLNDDVVGISQALLGKFLVTCFDEQLTAGMIVETEAYRGAEDKASHAYNHRCTARTETMYKAVCFFFFLIMAVLSLFSIYRPE